MSCHIQLYHESQMQTQNMNANLKREPKKDVTIARHLRANETSRHNTTCHMRHICMPGDQTIKNNFALITIC